jgi:hypothetical protein
MGLKAIIDKLEDVAEHFRELYSERNGKFELTGIEGMRTQADVDRISISLEKERKDHKDTKTKLEPWNGLEPEKVKSDLARIPELEVRATATGKLNDTQIETIVSARTAQIVGPLKLELNTAQTQLADANKTIGDYKTQSRQSTVNGAVRDAVAKAKVLPHATEDVLLLAERHFDVAEDGRVVTKANVSGVVAGLDPTVWLTQMQSSRPHWWGASSGGGAAGSGGGGAGGDNPFTSENWNMTKQSNLYRENPERAEQMAKAAGTSVGGERPAAKK